MIIIERSGPCEKDRPAGDAGYHGPVGGWFWRILDHQLDRARVKPVVDEAVIHSSVLHGDWGKLQAISVLVQGAPEGVTPLGDHEIVLQQPKSIVWVLGTLSTVTPLTNPLNWVYVGGGGHSTTGERDIRSWFGDGLQIVQVTGIRENIQNFPAQFWTSKQRPALW